MRPQSRYELTLLLAVLLGLLLYVTGCQSDRARLNAAEATFSATVKTLVILDDAGKIKPEWKPQIKAARLTTYAAILSLRADLDAGRPVDAGAALRAITAGLEQLAAYQAKAEAKP